MWNGISRMEQNWSECIKCFLGTEFSTDTLHGGKESAREQNGWKNET